MQAIKGVGTSKRVPQLPFSFLGLANYYRRFVKGYSKISTPLTNLLKKKKAWKWDEQCEKAFSELKAAKTEEPLLALPDHSNFSVHTDASDYAIGGVLKSRATP